MNRRRLILIITATLVAILGIGVAYQRCVQPDEAVWHPEARTWPAIPLGVATDGTLHLDSVREAVKLWNNAAGCALLAIGAPVSVRIQGATGTPCGERVATLEATELAGAWLCATGAAIEVAEPGDIRQQYLIAAHELGHVLGLAHDTDGRSVMHAGAGTRPDGVPVWVSERDAAALRGRYCNGAR